MHDSILKWIFILLYFFFNVTYSQLHKKLVQSTRRDTELTVLMELIGGVFVLLFIPFFPLKFPASPRPYLLLLLSCGFYAFSDRIKTTARRGLDVSTFSIIIQMMTVFTIVWGILFFREPVVAKKMIGAALILGANVLMLYRKGHFEFNRYVVYGLLAAVAMSLGIIIGVDVSSEFSLPICVALQVFIPGAILMAGGRKGPRDLAAAFREVSSWQMIVVGICWSMQSFVTLLAYRHGSVTSTAPILACSTIINVFAAYFILKERESLPKKILAACIAVFGILLIRLAG